MLSKWSLHRFEALAYLRMCRVLAMPKWGNDAKHKAWNDRVTFYGSKIIERSKAYWNNVLKSVSRERWDRASFNKRTPSTENEKEEN